MKSKVVYGLAGVTVLVISILVTGFLMRTKSEPSKNKKEEKYLYVKAKKVTNKKISADITHRGRVASYESVSLASEVNGRIMEGEVPFKEGENFEKGDLLVRIYDEDTRAAITSGKSNFLRTLSSILPDLKVDFPEEYKKWKAFFNSVNVHRELPELPSINSEKERVFMASMGVLTEYYSLKQQEIKLDKFHLYAPFDGAFTKVQRQVGAVANMGANLASIIRTDRLEVVVPVPPQDAKWIKEGNSVYLKDKDGHKARAEVSRIAEFLDERTQSVNVYVKYIPTGTERFKVGEFVTATFNSSRKVKGFSIPREALIDGQNVYLVEEQHLQRKQVKLERSLNDNSIISGIEDGKWVVTESLVDVSEDVKVKIRQ